MESLTKSWEILRTLEKSFFKTVFPNIDFRTCCLVSLEFSIMGAMWVLSVSHSCKILSLLMPFLVQRLRNTWNIFCTIPLWKLASFFFGLVNVLMKLVYLLNSRSGFKLENWTSVLSDKCTMVSMSCLGAKDLVVAKLSNWNPDKLSSQLHF